MALLHRFQALFPVLPIRVILIGLSVLQVLTIAIVLGAISFYSSRAAVSDVGRQLQAEVSARIEQHLQDFLGTAHRINQLNADLIALDTVDRRNMTALQSNFLALVKSFDAPSSVYFGTPQGGLVGAGREVTGEYYVTATTNMSAGTFVKTMVDDAGHPLSIALSVPSFDATTRPWYQRSLNAQQAVWSDVYVLFTGDDVAVAASRPVYGASGELLGVVAVDISAARLTDYLQSLKIGKTGMGFIMERSGLLVASSSPDIAIVTKQGASLTRITAADSENPVIQSAAVFLAENFGDYRSIREQALLNFSAGQSRFFVQVTPHIDQYGLDWLTVVVIPEQDFYAQVDRNYVSTVWLGVTAVLISIVLAAVVAQKASEPVRQLYASTRQLSAGRWIQMTHRSRVLELHELIDAYNQMVAQIQQAMEELSAEVARRRQTEAVLREREERLSLIVDGAQLGTWDWRIPTGEVTFNHRWTEMLGYEPDEIPARVESWQRLQHPDERDLIIQKLQKHLDGETPSYQIEHRLRTKDGSWKWILGVGQVIERNAQGNPTRAVGIHQDISERKSAEEALRVSHEELEATLRELRETQQRMMQQERLAAVGQLAAGIAHDFNNVLSAILMYGQLSLRDRELPSQLHHRLNVIVEQSRQGAELVQQILDFGRAAIMRMRVLDLTAVVQEAVNLARRTLPDSVEIQFGQQPYPVLVNADATRVQQAILNLLINARDAMNASGMVQVAISLIDHRQDGAIVCAECGLVTGGRWACVSVSDSGSGIAPEYLSHIFEPFFTSKGPNGHGLGLAQVHGIVKQHGGHIQVETRMNQGTSFYLYFPLHQSTEQEVPRLISSSSSDRPA